jgi:hypothetical protein
VPGIWPCLRDGPDGPLFELGPNPSPRHPPLTDDQIVRLLCEGSPFPRPSVEDAQGYRDELELDVHDSAARMSAVFCASIFHDWRDGTYAWRA